MVKTPLCASSNGLCNPTPTYNRAAESLKQYTLPANMLSNSHHNKDSIWQKYLTSLTNPSKPKPRSTRTYKAQRPTHRPPRLVMSNGRHKMPRPNKANTHTQKHQYQYFLPGIIGNLLPNSNSAPSTYHHHPSSSKRPTHLNNNMSPTKKHEVAHKNTQTHTLAWQQQ
jgi:hypothetical protein